MTPYRRVFNPVPYIMMFSVLIVAFCIVFTISQVTSPSSPSRSSSSSFSPLSSSFNSATQPQTSSQLQTQPLAEARMYYEYEQTLAQRFIINAGIVGIIIVAVCGGLILVITQSARHTQHALRRQIEAQRHQRIAVHIDNQQYAVQYATTRRRRR
jgi:hypothetical protein